jgi:hypothetical protein
MRGIGYSSARAMVKAGKIKAVRLSSRRLGIRSDEDARFLAQAERDV